MGNRPKEKGLFSEMIARMVDTIYPPLCMSCKSETIGAGGLCPACWAMTQFISGAICNMCGLGLPGVDDDTDLLCDGCLSMPHIWSKGRAAVVYDGVGRRITLALKHGDRLDAAKSMADWMIRAGGDVLQSDLIVPVPLHWTRLLKRKYNQAAVLGNEISKTTGIKTIPDMLVRHRRTAQHIGMTREDRFENQANAIRINSSYSDLMMGARVVLIDDVMTTGATLSSCAQVCLDAGAASVNILVFARVGQKE